MSDLRLTSVIVATWNTRELTASCLQSIFDKNRGTPLDVIVVDNGSSDGTADLITRTFPEIRVIANERNLGFARAINEGLAVASGDLIVLVNSDARLVSERPFARIAEFLERHPRVGIVGAKLVLPTGRIQSLGHSFLSLRTLVLSQIFFTTAGAFGKRNRAGASAEPIFVDCIYGAFLAIRREVVARIGPMNERYFMFAEDTEWCVAAHREGWEIAVLPDIEVLHAHGQSALKDFTRLLVINATNLSRLVWETRGPAEGRAAFWVFMLGMLLRIPVNAVRDPRRVGAYAKGLIRCAALLPRLDAILKGEKDVA